MPTRKQLQFNLETEFEARKISREYLKKIKMENWIDVKDRLPEVENSYIVFANKTIFKMYYGLDSSGINVWFYNDEPVMPYLIPTHWMPLPNPPVK